VNKVRSAVIAICSAAIVACSGMSSAGDPANATIDHARYSASEVELVGEGGLAAFMTRHRVQGSGPSYCSLDTASARCRAARPALDSASGPMVTRSADSLFAVIEGLNPFALKDDYGITVGGADMITYTLRVNIAGRSKTIRADDGTMPETMRKIADAVRATIESARK
jgi:hypothetical protein